MSRRLKLGGAIALLCLLGSGVAMAGWWDWFTGGGPVLRETATIGAQGVQIQAEFAVRKQCSYQLEIWLHHRQPRMGDFDAMLIDEKLPVTFALDIHSLASDSPQLVTRLEKRPRLNGRGARITTFILDAVVLEKGRYRADLRSISDASALAGVNMEFAVQVRPKTRC